MEDKNQHDKEPKLSLSEENEIRKLKMSAEKGAIFEGAENLPPELEKFMLDSIDDIESKINDAKQLTIFQHIGEPNLRPENELRDEQITTELEKLHRLFTDSNISIESMKPTSERQEYKFLTEHFVKEEIKVVGLEGMNYMFVFDEFRPREEMEVKVYVDDLFNAVFNKEYDLFKGLFFSKIEVPGGEDISYRTVIKKLKLFAEAFDEIKVERADFTIDRQFADEAKVTCDIEFVATIQGSRETVPFSGIAKFFMVETSDNGPWKIRALDFPGVNFS